MLRYLKLYTAFLRTCLMREMESRYSFIVGCIVILFFPILPLLLVGAIYSQVSSLGGWTLYQYMVLLGTFHIINGLIFTLFFNNMFEIPEMVRKGQMDFFLLKPVNSQFMLSMRSVAFREFAQVIPGIVMLVYGLLNLSVTIEWWQWLGYLLFIASGTVVAYAIWFISVLPVIWWVKMDSPELFLTIFDVARYHPNMFNGGLKFALTYILPVGIAVAAPADLLLGRLGWEAAIGSLLAAAVLLFISNRFWRFAQTRYYGASS